MRAFKLSILLIGISGFLSASPAILGGITYHFGNGGDIAKSTGATVKVISSGKDNKAVVGAGVTYYPWAEDKKFGFDVSAGYNKKHTAIMAGWDFLQNQPTVSLGYGKEVSDSDNSKFAAGPQDAVCKKGKEAKK